MLDRGGPQRPAPFHEQAGRHVLILICGDGRKEVALIGETIGSYRSALGERERSTVIFADVAASRPIDEFNPDLNATRNHRDLAGLDLDNSELRAYAKASLLRDKEHFAIRIVEVFILHRPSDQVHMAAHSRLAAGVSSRGNGSDA